MISVEITAARRTMVSVEITATLRTMVSVEVTAALEAALPRNPRMTVERAVGLEVPGLVSSRSAAAGGQSRRRSSENGGDHDQGAQPEGFHDFITPGFETALGPC